MNFLLCSKNIKVIFLNFETNFPTDAIFCPRLPPILCFFVCSALVAQTTRLIPLLEDDPYSYTDFKKIWSKSTNGVKRYQQLSTTVAQYYL